MSAHYWNAVLNEVLNKNKNPQDYQFVNARTKPTRSRAVDRLKKLQQQENFKIYALGEKYPGITLTKREAECMALFLKGKTNEGAAQVLGISIRTVEFYVKRMRTKLSCSSKPELIEKIAESDFSKNIDF